jgi:hypothetical protein
MDEELLEAEKRALAEAVKRRTMPTPTSPRAITSVLPDTSDYDKLLAEGTVAALRVVYEVMHEGSHRDRLAAATSWLNRAKGMPTPPAPAAPEDQTIRIDVTHRVLRELPTERLEALLLGHEVIDITPTDSPHTEEPVL